MRVTREEEEEEEEEDEVVAVQQGEGRARAVGHFREVELRAASFRTWGGELS